MHFFLIVLIFCFFIFLFCLHYISQDDLLLFRKNITTEKLFNIAFVAALVSLFFSRTFYVLFHFSIAFYNPLVFLLFPYFPGLSLAGGLLSGIAALFYLIHMRKMPGGKIFDLFSLSLLCALPAGYIGLFVLEGNVAFRIVHLLFAGVYFLLFLLFQRYFFPKVIAGKIKDGSPSLLIFAAVSLVSLVEILFFQKQQRMFITPESMLFSVFILVSLVLLFRQEKMKKPRR